MADQMGASKHVGPSKEKGPHWAFITATETINTDRMVSIDNIMLPCLSPNHNFTIRLMDIPEQCRHEMTYGVIMGQ